jgi:antitoxin FitA
MHSLLTMQSFSADWEASMGSMTIRGLDDGIKQRLRVRAARNNRSMEEEARAILRAAVASDMGKPKSLVRAIRARIEPLGGIDFTIEPREAIREVTLE